MKCIIFVIIRALSGHFFYSNRRIAYQESSQTFGIISMRMDVQEGSSTNPSRPSASTHATTTSSSSGSKMVSTGTSMMTEHMYGDEIEVHSLLIIDQHTFEGRCQQRPINTYLIFRTCICDKLFPPNWLSVCPD